MGREDRRAEAAGTELAHLGRGRPGCEAWKNQQWPAFCSACTYLQSMNTRALSAPEAGKAQKSLPLSQPSAPSSGTGVSGLGDRNPTGPALD